MRSRGRLTRAGGRLTRVGGRLRARGRGGEALVRRDTWRRHSACYGLGWDARAPAASLHTWADCQPSAKPQCRAHAPISRSASRRQALLAGARASLRAALEESTEPSAVATQARRRTRTPPRFGCRPLPALVRASLSRAAPSAAPPCAPPPPAPRAEQAVELLFCELCATLVLATRESARPLLKALAAMSALPPAPVKAVRRLLDAAQEAHAAEADAEETERLVAAVKAIALTKEARCGDEGGAGST